MTDSPSRISETEQFRRALEQWVLNVDPGEAFRTRLTSAMREAFGEDGTYGVFVRSDTNVEDLPGFTGAGLNLTVPNVVGEQKIFAEINRVWASPFTARAFAWRQALMDAPQDVYPAVLLQETVPVTKSGVLVTRDIDTGNEGWLSVAINEGVGGAVDGQPAESLRINMASGGVRLLAQASTTMRRVPSSTGGLQLVRASGSSQVLMPEEIARLVEFASNLPLRFPAITDGDGNPAPADVEFGFLGGELRLFQIRPFLENNRARTSALLVSLDENIRDMSNTRVDMTGKPQRGRPL